MATESEPTESEPTESEPTDLEAALRSLGTRLHVPDPPPVTGPILARLGEPAPRWPRRLVAAAVAALVALAAAVTVSPAVRATVLDLLRIGGVEIHETEPPPSPSLPPAAAGRTVTLAQARAAAGFPLALPAGLGDPTAVRVLDGDRVVTMTFVAGQTGTIRIDQFDGRLAPIFTKFTSAPDVHHVTVGGAPAIWVDRPHLVLYLDRDGNERDEAPRLAGSTLVWERDGVTYRVEGDLTAGQAITIAESLR